MGGSVTTRFAIALTVLGGCDVVWGLERGVDARVDPADRPPDVSLVCLAPSGHDEDHDGVDDACDNCPHVAQTTFSDDDTDGVGDACDPNPDRKDTQIAFLPMTSIPAGFPRVDPGTGTWEVVGDSVRLSGANVDGDYLGFVGANTRDVIVDTALTITAAPAVAAGHSQSVGVWASIGGGSDPTFPTGFVYELISVPTMHFSHITELDDTMAVGTIASGPLPEIFAIGTRYRVRLACQGLTSPTCVGSTRLSPSGTTSTLALPSGTTRVGSVGLRVHGDVTAVFEYLVVYAGPE